MPRPRANVPALRCHISGQSVVTIGGRDFYLGKHGSAESLARYAVLVSDYQKNGLSIPDGYSIDDVNLKASVLLTPIAVTHQANEPILIRHLVAGYREHIKIRYGKAYQTTDLARRLAICDELEKHDGKLFANDFGSKKLKEYRARFVKAGDKSRRYINKLVGEIRKIFRWGVSEELVDATVLVRLKSLDPLVGGEAAYETEDRCAVPIEHLRATAKHLTPVVRDMLTVQLATGMRPSEVCRMRPCDIIRTGDDWIYFPAEHKTKWKGAKRFVPLVGEARTVIENYLNRDPKSHCFSPTESMAWYRAKLKAECQGYGSYKKLKAEPKKSPKDCYDPHSYRQSIQRAAEAAKVPSWTPYQVRHLVGVTVGELLQLESAKALLGHSDIKTTQIYSKSTMRQAIEAAHSAPTMENK